MTTKYKHVEFIEWLIHLGGAGTLRTRLHTRHEQQKIRVSTTKLPTLQIKCSILPFCAENIFKKLQTSESSTAFFCFKCDQIVNSNLQIFSQAIQIQCKRIVSLSKSKQFVKLLLDIVSFSKTRTILIKQIKNSRKKACTFQFQKNIKKTSVLKLKIPWKKSLDMVLPELFERDCFMRIMVGFAMH